MDGTPKFTKSNSVADLDQPNGTITVSTNNGIVEIAATAYNGDTTPQYTASLNDVTTSPARAHVINNTGMQTINDDKKRKHHNSSSDKLKKKSSRVNDNFDLNMGKHSSDKDKNRKKEKKNKSSHCTSRQTLIENAFTPLASDSATTININVDGTEPIPTRRPDPATPMAAAPNSGAAAHRAVASTSGHASRAVASTSGTAPRAVSTTSATAIIVDEEHIDTLTEQVSASLNINNVAHPAQGKKVHMPFFGSTVTLGGSTSTPVRAALPQYGQQLSYGGPQHPAPRYNAMEPLQSYAQSKDSNKAHTEATQTSTANLSFQQTETTTPDFTILPQAEKIWKQARSCFVAHGKIRKRAQKLQEWAQLGLTPSWAVGTGPAPQHLLPKDNAHITRLGDLYRHQACESMKVHASGLFMEAEQKEQEGQALFKSLHNLYERDPQGLKRLTDIISRMVKNDILKTTTQLDIQEAELRASITCAKDVFLIRHPLTPDTAGQRQNQRGRQQRPRSPSTKRSKRRRSQSSPRPRNSSRGNRNTNSRGNRNTRGQSPNQVSFKQFKQWLK